jgi:hypothetical protein
MSVRHITYMSEYVRMHVQLGIVPDDLDWIWLVLLAASGGLLQAPMCCAWLIRHTAVAAVRCAAGGREGAGGLPGPAF